MIELSIQFFFIITNFPLLNFSKFKMRFRQSITFFIVSYELVRDEIKTIHVMQLKAESPTHNIDLTMIEISNPGFMSVTQILILAIAINHLSLGNQSFRQ